MGILGSVRRRMSGGKSTASTSTARRSRSRSTTTSGNGGGGAHSMTKAEARRNLAAWRAGYTARGAPPRSGTTARDMYVLGAEDRAEDARTGRIRERTYRRTGRGPKADRREKRRAASSRRRNSSRSRRTRAW